MKPKTIITVLLLLFVAASVTYLAVGEIRKSPSMIDAPAEKTTYSPTAVVPIENAAAGDAAVTVQPPEDPPAPSPAKASPETFVVVYYFHGNYRCMTCRTIEMYTREAVNEAFLNELGNDRLHLRILNMQDPENEAYVNDFGLQYYIVVLEKVVDGKRAEWKKLEGVWDLLGDKEAFKKYVIEETRNYLKGID